MAKHDIVPCFYDGQDRRTSPAYSLPRPEIKERRKVGSIQGWFSDSGKIFVIYRPPRLSKAHTDIPAGSGFDTAWGIRQSGPAGPLVWQLKSSTLV